MVDFDRQEFNADVISAMDDLRINCPDIEDSDSDDKVFCYLVANMFETTDPDVFRYTDGANDLGVDFYIQRDDNYRIYQCKSVKPETLETGKVFSSDPVNELAEAIDYLLIGEGSPSKEVAQLRTAYSLSSDDRTLSAFLAIEGRLSEAASKRFESVRQTYADRGVDVKLIDEVMLYEQWHSLESDEKPRSITLRLRASNDEFLRQNNWCCAVFPIRDLLKGMNKYGSRLFDLNVRSNLRRTSINDAIRESISTPKGKKQFELLNNGLVITCSSYKFGEDGFIELTGAQVVNGCQTLSTIWDYFQNATDVEKQELEENVRVFAKIINDSKAAKDSLLDKIVIASNNQNPMNTRNLKSNTSEQKRIQLSLATAPLKQSIRYFYIRKDGELQAYLDKESVSKNKSYRAKDFLIEGSTKRGINRYRFVDNEELAKIWWAWIGNGPAANAGSIKYFERATYRNIFEKKPGQPFWESYQDLDSPFNADLLEEGQASAYQLLLALAVSKYISYRAKPEEGPTRYKINRLEKLRQDGTLSATASRQEEASALAQDAEYLKVTWMSQMSYALTEIAGFLLNRVYDGLDAESCKKLLDLQDVTAWLECGMDGKQFVDPDGSQSLLLPLYDWIDQSAGSILTLEKNRILLSNRPKLELSKSDNIKAIKRQCLMFDESYRQYPTAYKSPGISFSESLPKI